MTVKLEVTKAAQDQVRQLIQGQKPGTAVRVFVQPGGGGGCGSGGCGCGGASTSYGLAFDRPRNGDEVVPVDGFSVVVDTMSAEFLNGAKIDFVEGLDASGFTVVSPNSPPAQPHAEGGGGCGCGAGGGCGSGGCC